MISRDPILVGFRLRDRLRAAPILRSPRPSRAVPKAAWGPGMGVFSSEDTGTVAVEVDKVAPFLLKLYEIVSSPASDDLVCWSEHGETFKIVNRTKFAGVSTYT